MRRLLSLMGVAAFAAAGPLFADDAVPPPPPPPAEPTAAPSAAPPPAPPVAVPLFEGEAVPPPKPPPAASTAAPSVAPTPAPSAAVLDYADGDPIPPGYHLTKLKLGPLFTAGAIVFASSYGTAAVTGIVEQSAGDIRVNNDTFIPLLIPVAGPFVTLATARHDATGAALLVALGVTEAAGLGMLLVGAALPRIKLVRKGPEPASMTLLPSLGRTTLGFELVGAM